MWDDATISPGDVGEDTATDEDCDSLQIGSGNIAVFG
jgi:hypothetical protein